MKTLHILLKNATVYDGSGGPEQKVDVGIADGKIVFIRESKDVKAEQTIDLSGLILAPGFLDIHSHSDYFILVSPIAESKLKQGVTTEIGGNCGYSAAPVDGEVDTERRKSLKETFDLDVNWKTTEEFFSRLASSGLSINYAHQIGFNTIRASVMGGSAEKATDDELSKMKELAREGMAAGAFGISAGLIYPPGCFAGEDEVIELCKIAAEHGGFFSIHMRDEGDKLIEAIEESVRIARGSGVSLQISHLKTSGKRNWHKIDRVIEIIESARGEGINANADRYPYLASFTGLTAVLPEWALEGTKADVRKRLKDPAERKKIKDDILAKHPEPEYLDKVAIAEVFDASLSRYEGKSVQVIADEENAPDAFEFLMDFLSEQVNEPKAIYHTMSEDNMKRILSLPYVMAGSDSAIRAPTGPLSHGKPHPRAYGTFARMIELARDHGYMSLSEAIKKMTSMPAKKVGLKDRGLIKEGYKADLVAFNLKDVKDVATYVDPHQYPNGIVHVFVNGVHTIKDGKHTGAKAGAVLKSH